MLSSEKGKIASPYVRDDLSGHIRIDDSKIDIQLQLPYYLRDGTLDHLEPYEFNGVYSLAKGAIGLQPKASEKLK